MRQEAYPCQPLRALPPAGLHHWCLPLAKPWGSTTLGVPLTMAQSPRWPGTPALCCWGLSSLSGELYLSHVLQKLAQPSGPLHSPCSPRTTVCAFHRLCSPSQDFEESLPSTLGRVVEDSRRSGIRGMRRGVPVPEDSHSPAKSKIAERVYSPKPRPGT